MRWLAPFLTCAAWLLAAPTAVASPERDLSRALEAYVHRPQPSYGWKITGRQAQGGGVEAIEVELVSQEWRGRRWVHRLHVVVPPAATGERARPGHCLLAIAGSGDARQVVGLLSLAATRLGVPIAVLQDVPNQPLFREETERGRGLKEDALIAYTFSRFAETGDPEWLALLPMTRAAVAAMDALGELSAAEAGRQRESPWAFGRLERFVTTGGSKRGWTTWLTGVVEPERVIGIAPIVFDNLNIAAQLDLHIQTWGHPSPSIHDYTDAGLMELVESERGRELLAVVDPYSYASRLDLPKLVLIGTNDTYWPLEAIHLYRGGLPGQLYQHYVPNAGHGAGLSAVEALVGFVDHVTDRIPALPELELQVAPGEGAVIRPRAAADGRRLRRVRLWGAHVEGRDFTQASWHVVDAARGEDGWRAPFPAACDRTRGNAAFIGEVELDDSGGGSFTIHTPVQVWQLAPIE